MGQNQDVQAVCRQSLHPSSGFSGEMNCGGGCVGKLVDQKSGDGRVREELALNWKHQEKGPENVKQHSQAIHTLGDLYPGKFKGSIVLARD